MSAPAVPRFRSLRLAGGLVACAAAGAGLRALSFRNLPAVTPQAASGQQFAVSPQETSRAAALTRESLAALSPEEQITALAAALPQMEIADILPLVEHLLRARGVTSDEAPADPFAAPPPDLISPLLRALFTRWAELDAAGLMAFVESGPLRYDYDARRLAVLALVEVRGLSALEEVRAKSPSLAREAAREMLIRNPQQLEALLPFLKGGEPKESLDPFDGSTPDSENQIAKVLSPELYLRYLTETGHAYAAWSALEKLTGTDPQRALQAVKSLTPGPGRDDLLANCLLTIAPVSEATLLETDYTVFRREFDAMADGPAKNRLTPYYAIVRMIENPDAALQWAQSLTDPRQRTRALIAISGGMFADCKNTFLDFYGREGDAAERITRMVAAAWTAAPPTGSLGQIPASDRWTYPFQEWHIKDAAASEAWLSALSNPQLRKALAGSVHMADDNRISFTTASVERVELATSALCDPISGRVPPAYTDYEKVPAAWLEAARISRVISSTSYPEEWATLTTEDRRAASRDIIRQQARGVVSPSSRSSGSDRSVNPRFLEAFNSMAPEERSLGAYYEAGAAYIRKDEAAASEWMESLPRGAERDAAATALVEHLVKPGDSRDGEAAFAWAAAMSGATERARYTAEAARAWAAEDPAAARAAVESSALPAAEKAALLNKLPEGGAR